MIPFEVGPSKQHILEFRQLICYGNDFADQGIKLRAAVIYFQF